MDQLCDDRKIVLDGKIHNVDISLKREQERAPKQLYDGKDVPVVLLPGFGKDRIYQARARPTRWHNIACHCSVEDLKYSLLNHCMKTRD